MQSKSKNQPSLSFWPNEGSRSRVVWLVLTLLLVALVGCGGDGDQEPTPSPTAPGPSAAIETATPTSAAVPSPPTATQAAPATVVALPTPTQAAPATAPATEVVAPPPETEWVGSPLDDFESGDFEHRWWSDIGQGSVTFTCTQDQAGHDSPQAMRLTFEIDQEGYAGCGTEADPNRWRDIGGFSFFWRADRAGLAVTVGVSMADASQGEGGVTPFQIELQTPGEDWTPVALRWADLPKAEWMGEGGAAALDPTQIVNLFFYVTGGQSGSVWVDDLQLLVAPGSVALLPTASPTPPAEATASPTSEPRPTIAPPTGQPGEVALRRIIFLHHSCGANLIEQGNVRQRLTALGYEFYDHGYNGDGLVLADGTWTGQNFDVPEDNTDPDGFAVIFAQPLHDPPDNTFSHLMQYDVIAFKSCFPVSLIESDGQLAEYKSYYRAIRDRMDQYPNKLFIVVTQPPEIPTESDAAMAARARAFTDWLTSDEFLGGHPNVVTFDFFDLLADPVTNMLRTEYQSDLYDAHPNELANRTIGPLFADFIDRAIRAFAP